MAEVLTASAGPAADALAAFLETMAGRRFQDGRADCGLTDADWVRAATGMDPAAHLRGRYATALGRERLLRRLGGLEAVMADCAARAGLRPTDDPGRGDVGLVESDAVELAAICLGRGRWAAQSRDGLAVFGVERVIRAWRVTHG